MAIYLKEFYAYIMKSISDTATSFFLIRPGWTNTMDCAIMTASCHAAPVRDARLRCDLGKTQSHCMGLGLLPSLRSIRAAHDGSALL